MDLGTKKSDWFKFVPEYQGNRALEEGQLSLEILPLRTIDQLTLADDDERTLTGWLEGELAIRPDLVEDMGSDVLRLKINTVKLMRLFVEHTRRYTHFEFDGEALDDPLEVFLRMPIPENSTGTEPNLLLEIRRAIEATAGLSQADLKNYVARCVGPMPAANALDAPSTDSLPPAAIQEEVTEP